MENIYKKVNSIVFGVLGPKEIKKMASVKIVTPELYDKEGYPVDGGLMDTRLGVIDPGLRCKTCGEKLKECIGHFGYIELARPIIHVKYVTIILDVLRSICKECGKVLMEDKSRAKVLEGFNALRAFSFEARRRESKAIIKSLKNVKKCPHCKTKQFTIKIEKPTNFTENGKRLSPIEIRARFEKIADEDSILLGLNPAYSKPEWLVLTVLPIPPVTMRPSITLETGERSEDDLTHKLGDIVRINMRLFENINAGAPEIIVDDLWDLLQYHITTYFDNTLSQVPPARHRSGQPLKTLTERLKSKEGRFRYNLAGKRVNFAARTVISPDPEIKFNEVGVPLDVAMELTVPERVTEWNINRLKKFVERGPKNYPGSNYVIRPDGKKKKITDEVKEQLLEELQPGYVVERHIMNGDTSIFNRQPSLHKMSIMAHKIRVIPGKSFRLNPSVCFPYNADFDGDEMNLHIPQTEEARAEAEILMEVSTQIISPKHGLNVIGCIEDSVTGNYLLTKSMRLSKEEAINMLVSIGIDDSQAFKKLKGSVSGNELFSVLLPKDFSLRFKSNEGKEVIIKNGELISGIIDNRAIGTENGVLIRELYRRYDERMSLDIINKIFRLGINVLLKRGFTSGVADTDLSEDLKVKIDKFLEDINREINELVERYKSNKIEVLPGKTLNETIELMVLQQLNKVRNKIGNIISESMSSDNSGMVMVKSGSRGNILNMVMMSANVGQQALRGRRIEKGYENRALSMFRSDDLGPRAHGFISKGFKSGLDVAEFFFCAMTGRDSLMDTALRTPKSGYLYRRLTNAMQDLKVEYDYTVRDANKTIIQFSYGEDNLDISKSEKGTINIQNIIKEVSEK